jgi:ArsR family transcriptional regulator
VDQPDDLRRIRVFHRALSDVNRLRIIQRLAAGPANVSDLIGHVGLSQPLVSWHLGRLRAAGIVTTRRRGRETLCTLNAAAFAEAAEHERLTLHLQPEETA